MSTEATPSAEDKARYDAARKELLQALSKKRVVDKQLATLEVQIYNFEGSYLAETTAHSGGNIIQGFDSYLKNQPGGRRKFEVNEHDRMFSNSSLTYQRSLDLVGEGEENGPDDGSILTLSAPGATLTHPASGAMSSSTTSIGNPVGTKGGGPTPGLTTVVLPPASRTQELTAAQHKKMRDKEYQRRKRANASMRSTVSGDDDADVVMSRRPTKRSRMADDD